MRVVELPDNPHLIAWVILDIRQVIGYFASVNRLADGLGVPLEEFWGETGATDH
jgi:hypothetical protein